MSRWSKYRAKPVSVSHPKIATPNQPHASRNGLGIGLEERIDK
jgi:hypothetical protein